MGNRDLSIANPYPKGINALQKVALIPITLGLIILIGALFNAYRSEQITLFFILAMVFLLGGTILFGYAQYKDHKPGIKNNGIWFRSLSNSGVLGWILGIALTAFYIALYWFPEILGKPTGSETSNSGLLQLFNPLSQLFKGQDASEWFVYGTLYTVTIASLGIKFLYKYRHNAYHFKRTLVVIAAQFFLAYFIPEVLAGMKYNDAYNDQGKYQGYYNTDIKNTWPLDYDFHYDWQIEAFKQDAYQPFGKAFLVWGILMFLVVTPLITYYVGKRWYCSWVCGCGGLAETAGDGFRQLSDKSTPAWLLERIIIHTVMVFILIATTVSVYTYFTETSFKIPLNRYLLVAIIAALMLGVIIWQKNKYKHIPFKKIYIVSGIVLLIFAVYTLFPGFEYEGNKALYFRTTTLDKWYGFFIGSAFSGVIGVGFYPMLGNRVWCRFGCPMAGYMGLIQRFKSRFRITTNGGQCISCGNCSTYCEQGIDVRAYAQRGENIVRASCVGCGVCSAVCPRGVLKLENGPEHNRIHGPIQISSNGLRVIQE
ncbi:MAG: 4Fe-4S binding protein [Bacteroidetes bacterium]|nr:4Fe-4S binding protein [Bacteroidota bacterium]